MSTKYWYQSKTIWLNALTTFAALLGSLAEQDWVKSNPDLIVKIMGIVGILNMILRWAAIKPLGSR